MLSLRWRAFLFYSTIRRGLTLSGGKMDYLALYRKWRPEDFKSLVGQDPIVRTLKNSLKEGKTSHAYLFSGVRGTGKTSTAKILAKALNCLDLKDGEPCNQCQNCLKIKAATFMDLIEIDAASNRGIDEIRDLKEKIKFLPVEGIVKVYIIDEVHMLTGEAFNALLKTLEEPPGHVVFILATTEPQKIPLTILSRCQKFEFHKIPNEVLTTRLRLIAKDTGGEITDDALNLITKLAAGGLRDGISLLDQALSSTNVEVTSKEIAFLAGIVDEEALVELFRAVAESRTEDVVKQYETLKDAGKSTSQLMRDLLEGFKNILLIKTLGKPEEYMVVSPEMFQSYRGMAELYTKEAALEWIYILSALEAQMKYSTNPDIILEIALLKGLGEKSSVEIVKPVAKVEAPVQKKIEPEKVIEKTELKITSDAPMQEVFAKFLGIIKKKNPLIFPFYEVGSFLTKEGKTLIIEYPIKYQFHQERAMSPKNKEVAEAILKEVTGKTLEFQTVLKKEEQEKVKTPEEKLKAVFGSEVTFLD